MASNIPKPPSQAWKLVKSLVADTVGPMAILAYGAQKFVSASAGAALNAQKMQQALQAVDGVDKIKLQFEALLGSSAAATRQIEMLAKVASQGAFSMPALADASKNLQVITNGALNTEAALRRVQDSAAASGTPVDVMATSVGELYAALERGDGTAAQAAENLARMGAISQSTAAQVAGMSKAGVSASAAFKVIDKDLSRSAGAASALGGTISGLTAQLEEIQRKGDVNLGNIFKSGQEAGLEASIAFEKFLNKVREANAAPWAAIIGGINNVKKSAAEGLNSIDAGTVSATFKALGSVSVGVLASIVVGILGLGKAALDAVLKIKAVQGALAGLKGYGKLWSGMTVGITAVVAAMTYLITSFVEATNRVKELNEEREKLKSSGAKEYGELYGRAQTATTPEEKNQLEADIDARIKESRQRRDKFAESRKESEERMQSSNPYVRFGFNKKAIYEAEQGMRDEDNRQLNLESLKGIVGANAGDSVDQKMLEISRERLKLEQDILKAARERAQASATPEMAKKLAEDEVSTLETKLKKAEETQGVNFEEQKNLEKTTKELDEKNSSRTDLAGAVARNAELEKTLGAKPGEKNEGGIKDWNWVTGIRARVVGSEEQIAEYKANEEKIRAAGAEAADFSGYDKIINDSSTTDLGRLQAERAKRQAMLNERGKAAADVATLVSSGADETALNSAKARLAAITTQMAVLEDVDTGQIMGLDENGVPNATKGVAIQALDNKINDATKDSDSIKIREELEAARIRKQTADEASAQDRSAIDATRRKLSAEKQLSALRNAGAAGAAAQVEFDSENQGLQKRLLATKAVEAAEEKYRNSKKGEADLSELNAVRVKAMEQGYQQGDSSQSVQLEIDGARQVLEIKKEIADLEKASAENRRNELMQEYRMQQQMLQIRLNDASGQRGGDTERDVARRDRGQRREKLQKALPMVARRDQITAIAESGGMSEAQARELKEINKELAKLGISGGETTADVEIKIKAVGMEEAKALIEEVEGRQRAASDMQIDMQRTIEEYGFGDQAAAARQERLGLQQKATEDQKYKEYKEQGFSGDDASSLSKIEAERERLADELAYEGKPKVSDLQAVGGGSGFVGLTGSTDKMDRLAQLAEAQKEILSRIAQQNENALHQAQGEIDRNSF